HARRVLELWRHHADDSDIAFVERDLLIEDGRISAKTPLPKRVAQHNDSPISFQPFFRDERSTQRRFHSEHVQVVGRHHPALQSLWLTSARQVHRYSIGDRSGNLREALALLAIVQKVRRRDALLFVVTCPSPKPQQPLRLGERQRLQQHGVDDAEDRRIRADAQAERENRDRREALVFEQHSQAEAQVLKHFVLQSFWL